MKLGVASLVSLVRIGLGTIIQFLLPAIALAAWGDAGFALVMSLQGLASYATMADAGLQGYLIQRAAALLGAGDKAKARAVLRVGFRLLLGLAAIAALITMGAFVLFGERLWREVATDAGSSPAFALISFGVVVASVGIALSFGGWSTALESGVGRLARVQLFGASRYLLNTGGVVLLAFIGFEPLMTLVLASLIAVVHDVGRAFVAWRQFFRPLPKGDSVPHRSVLIRSSVGMLQTAAAATQMGLQTSVATGLDIAGTAAAVPGRTLSNTARQLSGAVGNVAWVAVARAFARLDDAEDKYALWASLTRLLCGLQFFGAGFVGLIAPLLLSVWLPDKASTIMELVPLYLVEQSLFSMALIGNYLLISDGKFGRAGAISMIGAIVTVALTLWLVPTLSAVGFAFASLVGGAAVVGTLMLIAERRWWANQGIDADKAFMQRLALICGLSLLAFLTPTVPLSLTSGVLLLVGAGFAIVGGREVLKHREPSDEEETPDDESSSLA